MITSINEFKQYFKEQKQLKENANIAYFDALEKFRTIKDELAELQQRRKQLDIDMENEAGQMGDQWSDEDANRYGGMMNDLDIAIEAKEAELDVANTELEEADIAANNTGDDDDVSYYSGLEGDLINNARYIVAFRKQFPNASLDDEANDYKKKFSLNSTIEEIKLALFDLDEEIVKHANKPLRNKTRY